MAKTIFLIGYMGCGKSTVGKKLATRMQYDFIDIDAAIEKMTGKSVGQIFQDEGEDAFRQLEHSVIVSTCARNNLVVSTGGGAPCFFDNMKLMNQNGITVYLQMHPDSLTKRIRDSKTGRPLLKNVPDDYLGDYIALHLAQRERFYKEAALIIKGESLKIEELHTQIIRLPSKKW